MKHMSATAIVAAIWFVAAFVPASSIKVKPGSGQAKTAFGFSDKQKTNNNNNNNNVRSGHQQGPANKLRERIDHMDPKRPGFRIRQPVRSRYGALVVEGYWP
ncbi:unnamed protein product [Polarella glacialis]|uniref:PS II complex 12 kDa extrinsic protein n=1 Tax=Polarella glacialis TaxID=89957 RepID=A0A813F8C4_POLGL|nr:unnamed protein product [Polarella glacialis]